MIHCELNKNKFHQKTQQINPTFYISSRIVFLLLMISTQKLFKVFSSFSRDNHASLYNPIPPTA